MIFSYPDPSSVYFGDHIPEKHQDIFEPLIHRAVDLIDIQPENTFILEYKQINLEEMIVSLNPHLLDPDYEESEEEPLIGRVSYARLLYENINLIELDSSDSFS